MATFSYLLRGNGDDKQKQTVIVRFTHNGEHFPRTTGVKVLAKNFDRASGKVNQKADDAFKLNSQIELVRSRIDEAVNRVKKRQLELTPANVRSAYDLLMEQVAVIISPKVTTVFGEIEQDLRNEIEVLEAQLAAKKAELKDIIDFNNGTNSDLFYKLIIDFKDIKRVEKLSDNTKQNYVVSSNLIKKYYPTVKIDEVNEKILTDLRDALSERGMRNSSINEHFIRVKAVIKYYAELDEYKERIDVRYLDKVKVAAASQDKTVIFLEPTELKAIEKLELVKPRQQYIRDMFLLSCYTGLRHVDLYITQANVSGGNLQFLASKTNKAVSVPFFKKAQKLMDRMAALDYNYEPQTVGNFSVEVKAICKLLPELQHKVATSLIPTAKGKSVPTAPKYTLMSSKVGRKTFINNCLIKGVKIEIVADWVGHSKLDMIQNHYTNKLAQSNAERHKMENEDLDE